MQERGAVAAESAAVQAPGRKARAQLARDLAPIVGRRFVSIAREDRILVSYDATREAAMPDVVVTPRSAAEIAEILRYANRQRVPVVPRGAATGLSGGALPVRGGIVLDLHRMDRIIEVDEANLIATVEPGVVIGQFQREVEKRGLYYPPDPASADYATMGGSVAECAGGLRALKYGVTRDYVLGLEVVLPQGDVIHTGAKTLKSVTGYDLTRLLVGSEGTLGIFTKIIVRLIPLPLAVKSVLACFGSSVAAADAATAIIEHRILPTVLEFMDRACIDCVRRYRESGFLDEAEAALLIDVDGDEASTDRLLNAVIDVCWERGARLVFSARTPEDREDLWAVRRAVSPALYAVAPNKLDEDVCVMPSMVPELLRRVEEFHRNCSVYLANYGHIGEGNIHVAVMYHSDEKSRGQAHEMAEAVLRIAVDLGGTLSGEHGIGTRKQRFLPLEIAPAEMALMRNIKKLLDPNDIMNPGKIFPEGNAPGR